MEKYVFKNTNQSPWIVDVYNGLLPFKNDGYLVEIGVGHTILGIDKESPKNIANFERCSSNTADLLDIGWSGIYVDPVKEYCEEAEISHKQNLDRLKILNFGASNEEGEFELFLGDSFVPNQYGTMGYEWIGRKIKVYKTSDILLENNAPKEIDIMSIDVEGFEEKVINGIDFTLHKPKILVIEINDIGIDRVSALLPSDYKLIKNDNLNAIWSY